VSEADRDVGAASGAEASVNAGAGRRKVRGTPLALGLVGRRPTEAPCATVSRKSLLRGDARRTHGETPARWRPHKWGIPSPAMSENETLTAFPSLSST
jgi:hypothetical protein